MDMISTVCRNKDKGETVMKSVLKKRLIFALAAVMLFSAFAGCSAENGEKKAGVSFEKIVCRYEIYPSFSADNRPTAYTLYADNTVISERKEYAEDRIGFNDYWTTERTFSVTEAEKQAVIDAVRKNRLWSVGKCSNTNVTDSANIYIILFDENGEAVSTNGGYHPTNKRFTAVKRVIQENIVE